MVGWNKAKKLGSPNTRVRARQALRVINAGDNSSLKWRARGPGRPSRVAASKRLDLVFSKPTTPYHVFLGEGPKRGQTAAVAQVRADAARPQRKRQPAERPYAGMPDGRRTMITSKHLFIGQSLACLGAAAASVGCGAASGAWFEGSPSGASVRQAEVVGAELPVLRVDLGSLSSSVPVSNAEAVVHMQIQPGARRCYWKGLEIVDPNQSGALVLLIKVAPDGRVDSVSAGSNTGLSEQVAGCVQSVAKRAMFDAPGGNGATISVPFNFLKQGGA
jgi:hypothetical protein